MIWLFLYISIGMHTIGINSHAVGPERGHLGSASTTNLHMHSNLRLTVQH